jgi:site-specific DNA-methyltransferase (adenine-specific)
MTDFKNTPELSESTEPAISYSTCYAQVFSHLFFGDCLIESDKIESGSVDLILTDLPYGNMNTDGGRKLGINGWDLAIEPKKVYEIANRILRKNGKMILFSQEPYTTKLITEAIPNIPFGYRATWEKDNFAVALGAKVNMVSFTEDILVFSKNEDTEKAHPLREYFYTEYEKTGLTYKEINKDYLETTFEGGGGMAYNMLCRTRLYFSMPTQDAYNRLQKTGYFNKPYEELKIEDEAFKNKIKSTFNLWEGKKYKSNILKYKKDYNGYHPTQKPILLLEDLIKTFSNENDLVVDLTMGSGSTGVACKNTNRNFIGIEKDEAYFKIAEQRINARTLFS